MLVDFCIEYPKKIELNIIPNVSITIDIDSDLLF